MRDTRGTDAAPRLGRTPQASGRQPLLSTTEPAGEITSGTQCEKFTENSQGWNKNFR
ncbi:hypothetical protein GCM10010412_085450 [Nonomuraea recticatena]|uniref:Uncharacterized protein n=1 Tax=Nonomuraea recticatena TaxID=46178 RepID=A0ABN3T4D9_9ACTN